MTYFSITITIQAPFKPVASDNSEVELDQWPLTFFVIWRLAYYNIHTLFMFSLVLFVKLWSVFFQFLITDKFRKVLAVIYHRIHTEYKHDAAVLMLHG